MESKTFDLRTHFDKLPKEARKPFRKRVMTNANIEYQTFYSWLSKGIPLGSQAIGIVKIIIAETNVEYSIGITA